MEFILLVVWTY